MQIILSTGKAATDAVTPEVIRRLSCGIIKIQDLESALTANFRMLKGIQFSPEQRSKILDAIAKPTEQERRDSVARLLATFITASNSKLHTDQNLRRWLTQHRNIVPQLSIQ